MSEEAPYPLRGRQDWLLLQQARSFCLALYQVHLEGFVVSFSEDFYLQENGEFIFLSEKIVRPSVNWSSIYFPSKSIGYLPPDALESTSSTSNEIAVFYTLGYNPWEAFYQHSDVLSNNFSLALWLCNHFFGVDVNSQQDLENLFEDEDFLNSRLNSWPILAAGLKSALSLDRSKRWFSVYEAIKLLEREISELAKNQHIHKQLHASSVTHNLLAKCKDLLLHQNQSSLWFNYQRKNWLTYSTDWNSESQLVLTNLNSSAIKRLKSIYLNGQTLWREKGIQGIYACCGILEWKTPDNELLKSPILFIPVNLVLEKNSQTSENEYNITIQQNYFEVNQTLRYYLLRFYQLHLPETVAMHSSALSEFAIQLELLLGKDSHNTFRFQCDLSAQFIDYFSFRHSAILEHYDFLLQKETHPFLQKLMEGEDTSGMFSTLDCIQNVALPADPSQLNVLSQAKEGRHLLIQGPPGTGKSQTIVNLIANALAENKTIMMVADKKVALEVVYERLKQVELGHFTCLISDLQKDKKEVLQALQDSLAFFEEPLNRDMRIMISLKHDAFWENLEKVKTFEQAIRNETKGLSFIQTIRLAQELEVFDVDTEPFKEQFHQVPDLKYFIEEAQVISDFQEAQASADFIWKTSILSDIAYQNFKSEPNIFLQIKNLSGELQILVPEVLALAQKANLNTDEGIGNWVQLVNYARASRTLLLQGVHYLIDTNQEKSRKYDALILQYQKKLRKSQQFSEKIEKIKPVELWQLEAIQSCDSATKRQFISSNYKVTYEENEIFDEQFLANCLKFENNLIEIAEIEARFKRYFGIEQVEIFDQNLQLLRDLRQRTALQQATFFAQKERKQTATLLLLLEQSEVLQDFSYKAERLFIRAKELSFDSLTEKVQQIDLLRDEYKTEKLLYTFYQLPIPIQIALNQIPIALFLLKQLAVIKNLNWFYHRYDYIADFSLESINNMYNQLNISYKEALWANAQFVIDEVRRKVQIVQMLMQLPAAKLNPEEKSIKWKWRKGLTALKKEFNKKSHLTTLWQLHQNFNIKTVLDSFNKVFLLSPSAASELLKEGQAIDLLIFDEASQLKIAEVLPLLSYANQTIVVGDQQQLPPDVFFQSSSQQQLPSLLSWFQEYAPSNMLTWHYRSQSADLISFSNAAFYQKKLSVFPHYQQEKIKPIHFEYINPNSSKAKENNQEAQYLANYSLELLKKGVESIAIVTFSLKQQYLLQDVLLQTAKEQDSEYLVQKAMLDKYNGLLISNLENIQGDERDYVLIAISFVPTNEDSLRIYFGPIAQKGGERRLNVLFSRARHQMVLASSLLPEEIHPKENYGIWILQQFLKYAKACSENKTNETDFIVELLSSSKQNQISSPELTKEVQFFSEKFLSDKQYLKPLNKFNIKSFHLYLLVIEEEQTAVLFAFDNLELNTFQDWFVIENIIVQRGWQVIKIPTQLLFSQNKTRFNSLKAKINEIIVQQKKSSK